MSRVAILLAAGESRRLGQPKQLLLHDGETLVRRVVRTSIEAGIDRVIVVTGARADDIAADLESTDCLIVRNRDWQKGMGGSIACGAQAVASSVPDCESVLLQLCDQPFVPASHLKSLLASECLNGRIAATRYPDSTHGPPVCFPARYLDALGTLSGNSGAKALIAGEQATYLACAEAAHDIDVASDLKRLR